MLNMHNTTAEPYSPLLRVYTEQMSHFKQWTNQAETFRLSILTPHLVLYQDLVKQPRNIIKTICVRFQCSKQLPWTKSEHFPCDTRRTERATQRENWQKFAQLCCGYLQGQGEGRAALQIYSTHRISERLKYENWKYFMRGHLRTVLEYFKQILLWTSTKCHINYTYTCDTPSTPDIYILHSSVFKTKATELLTLLALDWYLRAFLVSWVAVCT